MPARGSSSRAGSTVRPRTSRSTTAAYSASDTWPAHGQRLTPSWAGTWTTNYDFEAHKFGSHTVALQRDLHDWKAIFGFTQAPNGNFAFNFFIALNAEPDLKFNYDRATYRPLTP